MKKGTDTRKAYDRALQSLPITQHKDVWKSYIAWVTCFGVEETAIRVYRRFLMFDSSQREKFVRYDSVDLSPKCFVFYFIYIFRVDCE